jgi:hypothetical protein
MPYKIISYGLTPANITEIVLKVALDTINQPTRFPIRKKKYEHLTM